MTEATGVTDLHGTVVRLFFPEGTLVVEVDDPGVRVSIDGEDLVITGAGAQEIRLKSGRHTLQAMKDGKVLKQELITVTRNGRRVVRVHREEATGPGVGNETADAGQPSGVEVSGQGPVATLAARLKSLNPRFKGSINLVNARELVIRGDGLTDISPVLDLPGLGTLECTAKSFSDLTPIRRLKLADLSVRGTSVADLGPLRGMELTNLELTGTPVSNLGPLKGMPLRVLQVAYTAVTDLSPLVGMKLIGLNCDGCRTLTDLSPVKGMRLNNLRLRFARVSDLSPLKGMPLQHFDYSGTLVTDITPLKAMPLEEVICDFQPERDEAVLRAIPTLKTINGRPAAEFWKDLDKATRGGDADR
jgi:hypothetical protein